MPQRLRPDDADVLISSAWFYSRPTPSRGRSHYRRLALENPNVFILHSNLGLILYKQGKLDERKQYLLRAIDYVRTTPSRISTSACPSPSARNSGWRWSTFALRADKIVCEVEAEMRPQGSAPVAQPIQPSGAIPKSHHQKIVPLITHAPRGYEAMDDGARQNDFAVERAGGADAGHRPHAARQAAGRRRRNAASPRRSGSTSPMKGRPRPSPFTKRLPRDQLRPQHFRHPGHRLQLLRQSQVS